MKNIILLFVFFTVSSSCESQKPAAAQEEKAVAMKPEKNEDGEWDIEVIDTQYNYFLSAIAHPMNFYTESTLKTRNRILVNEWNSHFYAGRYRNIIESAIDYNPMENYGLKFEYKLYQVFAYVQWKYRLRLSGLSGAEVR